MASMKLVNKMIKSAFPNLDIEAVKGPGYVYFNGNDGLDKIPSTYVHVPAYTTEQLAEILIFDIKQHFE